MAFFKLKLKILEIIFFFNNFVERIILVIEIKVIVLGNINQHLLLYKKLPTIKTRFAKESLNEFSELKYHFFFENKGDKLTLMKLIIRRHVGFLEVLLYINFYQQVYFLVEFLILDPISASKTLTL